jgi:hypothetical protein
MHTSRTLRDLLAYQQVVRQQFETSCGSASLATIMTHYYGEPITEKQILRLVMPENEVPERGLSIQDLEHAAQTLGYRAKTYRIDLSLLLALVEPAVLVLCPSEACPPGPYHFSVFQGYIGSTIYLADPARGHIVLGQAYFQRLWTGIILVLAKDGATSSRNFFRRATDRPQHYLLTTLPTMRIGNTP